MIFTIQTSDEVAGLDIMEALLKAGISHIILSKQHEAAADVGEETPLEDAQ